MRIKLDYLGVLLGVSSMQYLVKYLVVGIFSLTNTGIGLLGNNVKPSAFHTFRKILANQS